MAGAVGAAALGLFHPLDLGVEHAPREGIGRVRVVGELIPLGLSLFCQLDWKKPMGAAMVCVPAESVQDYDPQPDQPEYCRG